MKNKVYSLKDFMTDSQKLVYTNGYCLMPNFNDTTSEGIWKVLNDMAGETLSTDTKYTRTLWCKYLWPEIHDSFIWLDADDENAKDNLIASIAKWLFETQEVYEKIIDNATNKYNDLFAAVKNTTQNIFNDTPQAGEAGLFDHSHATNTTETESTNDVGTPVQRLLEVESFIKSYYARWTQAFINKYVIL